jgi:anion-transporting  ArsA/GET3 family ATPase
MLAAFVSLLDRQMLFVTGKGGVGKTVVTAALALASERSGRRTIVCELAGQARIPELLGAEAGKPGEEVRIGDKLFATSIEPYKVMEEWIGRILGSQKLTGLLTRSNFFRAFADAAPGGMELGQTVKTWELAQAKRWDRKKRGYDTVIVDGPAMGHAIGMLRTPKTFADIARVGPIASQSERVREWLGDPKQTAYVAVALPAELPVSETIDLGGRLRKAIGRRLETVVANGVVPDRFTDEDLAAIEAAAPGSDIARAAHGADARAAHQHEHLARLSDESDAPVIELPFLFAPRLGRAHIEELADRLGPL